MCKIITTPFFPTEDKRHQQSETKSSRAQNHHISQLSLGKLKNTCRSPSQSPLLFLFSLSPSHTGTHINPLDLPPGFLPTTHNQSKVLVPWAKLKLRKRAS